MHAAGKNGVPFVEFVDGGVPGLRIVPLAGAPRVRGALRPRRERKHLHPRRLCVRVEGVEVDAHEKVRRCLVRDLGADLFLDADIGFAGHDDRVSLGLEELLQPLGDLERISLLHGPERLVLSPVVLTAVPGIDGDHVGDPGRGAAEPRPHARHEVHLVIGAAQEKLPAAFNDRVPEKHAKALDVGLAAVVRKTGDRPGAVLQHDRRRRQRALDPEAQARCALLKAHVVEPAAPHGCQAPVDRCGKKGRNQEENKRR